MFPSALAFVAFACLLPNGSSLKCYTCSATQVSNANIPRCSNTPKNQWNITDCSAVHQHLDRCAVQRVTDIKNGVKVTEEGRYCLSAAKCAHYWLNCEAAKKRNSTFVCDVECCKDNLCNEEPKPQKYEFFKPSGKSLSCYTCSDFPRGTRLAGSVVYPVPRNCTSPIKQKCSYLMSLLQPDFMQDRCITLKVKAVVPGLGNKVHDWTYRGCSSIYHCSFTEALWRYELNATSEEARTGISYLAGKSSCCHGNLCSSTTDDSSVHSTAVSTKVEHSSTGFLCFVVIAIIKAHIG